MMAMCSFIIASYLIAPRFPQASIVLLNEHRVELLIASASRPQLDTRQLFLFWYLAAYTLSKTQKKPNKWNWYFYKDFLIGLAIHVLQFFSSGVNHFLWISNYQVKGIEVWKLDTAHRVQRDIGYPLLDWWRNHLDSANENCVISGWGSGSYCCI